MSLRQIIILLVAAAAAVGAMLFARSGQATTAAPGPAPREEAGAMVLAAKEPILAGHRAEPSDLAWIAWPADNLNPAFFEKSVAPTALEDFAGAVARIDLMAGEPITAQRLVKTGDQGFMAAILTPGYLAVAVPVRDESAASGFILPGDRVDVILAWTADERDGDSGVKSETVLENVRVLTVGAAVNAELGEPKPLSGSTITLELTSDDAETLALARRRGDLQFVLRSLEQQTQAPARKPPPIAADAGPVKLHAFGEVSEGAF